MVDKVVALCLVAFMLPSCTSNTASTATAEVEAPAGKASQPAQSAPVSQPAANAFVFDVPALLTKNIDQITQQLGKPKEEDSPNLTTAELERRYSQKGYNMVVTYNTETRKAESIMLVADSGKMKSCAKLLRAGNLQLNNPRYSVDSLASEKEGYYESIVATSN